PGPAACASSSPTSPPTSSTTSSSRGNEPRGRDPMRYFVEIARTGLTAILLHPLRSLVTTAAVLAVLLPYLVGLGIARGVQEEAEAAVRFGADLYVSGEQFGRPVPVPLAAAAEIRQI